jgi:Caspase domain
MTRRLASLIFAIGAAIWLTFAPSAALAGKRVALVVGNSRYQSVNALPNPSRDALAMAKLLKDAGFDTVDTLIDVGNLDFKRAIRKFEDETSEADIAVIYYAGHGLEIGDTNYLIPVDARLASDRDAPDEAITLDRLVSSADSAKKLRVIILDACRDNPFLGRMRRDSIAARRGITSGLARVDPSTTDTLIAYAAKAGSTAEDGTGDHSPFTTALLKDLTVPGRDIRIAFGYVKDDVMKATGGQQEPFVYGSLGGGVYTLVPAPEAPTTVSLTVASTRTDPAVKADFDLVNSIGTRKAWQVFLSTYPNAGLYSDLARERLSALPPEVQTTPATTKEALDWDKLKDSTDKAALQNFIARYPDSPLAVNAKSRIDALVRAEQERADKERQAAEEAARKQAEAVAAKKREEEEQKAKAAEAEQKAKAEQAARDAAEAKRKADQAAQKVLAAAVAAKLREENERAAKPAEDQRQAAATAEAACKQQADQLATLQAKGSAGTGVADMTKFVQGVTCDRVKPLAVAALNSFTAEAAKRDADAAAAKAAKAAEDERQKVQAAAAAEAVCKQQGDQLTALQAKGSAGTGVADMTKFVQTVTCDRIKPLAMAALNTFTAEAAKRDTDRVRTAQTELTRIGCYTGAVDGVMSDPTKSALTRYLSAKGLPTKDLTLSDELVGTLKAQKPMTCLRSCPSGESLKGDTCIANAKPAPAPEKTKSAKRDDTPRRKPDPQPRQQAERPAPRASEPASNSRPAVPHATMVGVGF